MQKKHLSQKSTFKEFEQWGMGLAMFEWSAFLGQNRDNMVAVGRFPVLRVPPFFTDYHHFMNEA